MVKLDSQPVRKASARGTHIPTGLPSVFLVALHGLANDPHNSPTDSIGFTHDLDSLPDSPEDFSVMLTHVSQTSGTRTPSPCFHFPAQSQNFAFQAYTPVTDPWALASHIMNNHDDDESQNDRKLYQLQPIPGCATCRGLVTTKGYPEWRSEWNAAAATDDILTFEIKVTFDGH